MKVSELIELLQQLDGDAQVIIATYDLRLSKDVFLEPVDVDDSSFEVYENQVTISAEEVDA